MIFEGGFTFSNFLADMFAIFLFILWFWLLVVVFGDLFRRHDVSGLGKVIWLIVLVVLPYLGIFAYLLTQGAGMAGRDAMRSQQSRQQLRQIVSVSPADEIEKLEKLRSSGSITDEEYGHLRARIFQ